MSYLASLCRVKSQDYFPVDPLWFRDTALSYRNRPFKHKGKTKAGVDCRGLGLAIYRDMGINLDYADVDYSETFWKFKSTERLLLECISPLFRLRPNRSGLRSGNVILFSLESRVCHAAYYIGEEQFVHVTSSGVVTVDAIATSPWTSRFHSQGALLRSAVKG